MLLKGSFVKNIDWELSNAFSPSFCLKFLLMEVVWKWDLWRVSLDGVEYVDQDKENCDQ